MAYKLEFFVADPKEQDNKIRIYDRNQVLKYSLDPNNCIFYVQDKFIFIKQDRNNDIILDFDNPEMAKYALKRLNEVKLKILRYLDGKENSYSKDYIDDNYYTKNEVYNLVSGITFNPAYYYTTAQTYNKTEINYFLDGKSDTGHTHSFDSLSGVSFNNLLPNQFLVYDGSFWTNSSITITGYYTKEEIDDPTGITNIVHKTGDETINGSKTFNNLANFNSLFISGNTSSSGITIYSLQDSYLPSGSLDRSLSIDIDGNILVGNELRIRTTIYPNVYNFTFVDSFNKDLDYSVIWEYTAKSGTSIKTGVILASWDTTTNYINYSSYSNNDYGTTNDIDFTVEQNITNLHLKALHTGQWDIKLLRRFV